MELINKDTQISEILKMYPELTDFLIELGLCGCGHDSTLLWTVERVAREKGIPLAALIEKLNAGIS
ncbi:MAG: DUF1858 domain-containing protein [Deltaproteobacteria bacterium]